MDTIPYKSFEEQLENIKDKNIYVNNYDNDIALNRLKNHPYYSLVNGYKPHFVAQGETDIMRDGSDFNHFYAVKILEMDLSAILLKYLQVIEQGFRTRISHIIAREFTTDDQKYLEKSNYVNNRQKHKTLIYFNKLRENPNVNSYSYYFKEEKKTAIPPWILLQDADFYRIINLYSCLPEKLRSEVRSEYMTPTNSKKENIHFANSMQLLREYRNIYAHSKRNFNEKINYSLDFSITAYLKTQKMFNRNFFDQQGKGKGLNVVIPLIFSYLNDHFLFFRLENELKNLFINDGYIDQNFNGVHIFNDLSIYDVLELPEDFFIKIEESYPIPSG